jgi:hypothetical protein
MSRPVPLKVPTNVSKNSWEASPSGVRLAMKLNPLPCKTNQGVDLAQVLGHSLPRTGAPHAAVQAMLGIVDAEAAQLRETGRRLAVGNISDGAQSWKRSMQCCHADPCATVAPAATWHAAWRSTALRSRSDVIRCLSNSIETGWSFSSNEVTVAPTAGFARMSATLSITAAASASAESR